VLNKVSVKAELLLRYYNNPLAGHFGADRTEELLRRKYHWDKMDADVKEYVSSYNVC